MFLERSVKTKISSVGATCKIGTCRPYGACEFYQQNHYKYFAPLELKYPISHAQASKKKEQRKIIPCSFIDWRCQH